MADHRLRLLGEITDQGTLSLTKEILAREYSITDETFVAELIAMHDEGLFTLYTYDAGDNIVDVQFDATSLHHADSLQRLNFAPTAQAFAAFDRLLAEGGE